MLNNKQLQATFTYFKCSKNESKVSYSSIVNSLVLILDQLCFFQRRLQIDPGLRGLWALIVDCLVSTF